MAGAAGAGSLLYKRLTVNALTNGRVCLVSCDAHLVKSTVVFIAAVVFALLYGTFNGGIRGLVFHDYDHSFLTVISSEKRSVFQTFVPS